MDPNTALDRLRELSTRADCELAEQFIALDEWLKAGGFLPASWLATRDDGDAYERIQHVEP